MKEKVTVSGTVKTILLILIALGIASFVFGFVTDGKRAWANFLLVNYYFLQIAIGAAFFMTLQSISQAGWSAGFKRVPEAISLYIPVAAIFFLLLVFGIHSIYEWSHKEVVAADELIRHKTPFLNTPFFYIRLLLYFALWTIMVVLLRRTSLKEDIEGGMVHFHRTELLSKIFIFILALTFSLASFDWIMSIDAHWFSTLFAAKNFVAAFYHGSTIVVLVIFILYRRGYFTFLNKSHVLDLSRYIFILSIIWGYFWFAQFMLIWYGNIPEETVYYVYRMEMPWKLFFIAEIAINWFIPFLLLMPKRTGSSMQVVAAVIILLIVGQWIDLYGQIMPGTVHKFNIGIVEIGGMIGYGALFALVVIFGLERAALIPKNHPYLEESLEHHV